MIVPSYYVEDCRIYSHCEFNFSIKKSGIEMSCNTITDRLLGGVVFVENLYKDPGGRLFMSLDKYDTTAQGMYF